MRKLTELVEGDILTLEEMLAAPYGTICSKMDGDRWDTVEKHTNTYWMRVAATGRNTEEAYNEGYKSLRRFPWCFAIEGIGRLHYWTEAEQYAQRLAVLEKFCSTCGYKFGDVPNFDCGHRAQKVNSIW